MGEGGWDNITIPFPLVPCVLPPMLCPEQTLGQSRLGMWVQKESYTGQMNVLKDQIAYSTVEVYLDEVTELTPQSPGFASRVGSAFRGGWNGFVAVVQELVIGLIYLLPFLVVAAVVIVVVVLLARRAAKKHPRPSAQKQPGTDGANQPPKYTQMK